MEKKKFEWVEHLGKAFDAFFKDLKGVVPDETYNHLKGSKREMLLAIRSIIDREIERLEKEQKKGKAKKVEIE